MRREQAEWEFMNNVTLAGKLTMLSGSSATVKASPFGIVRDPERIYLEEYFQRKPGVNGDIAASAEGTRMIANPDFEVLGVNHSTDDVAFDAPTGGIKMETDGSNQDAISIFPHADTTQTKWALAGMWGSENQVDCEIALRTGSSIATQTLYAGLKKADDAGNNHAYATDSDQVCFWFSTDDTEGAFTTNANLHCIVSSGGTDYITDLGFALAADTDYRLTISLDRERKPSVWVNGKQYSLTSDATAGGVETGTGVVKGPALAVDINLFPTMGIVARAGSAFHAYLYYIKASRMLNE
jgi:hypothetical protein